MRITEQTRRESYRAVKPDSARRRDIILKILDDNELTAHEIVETLIIQGAIPYYERNFAAPRLTELKKEGKGKAVGMRRCERTGRMVAVWAKT